MPERGPQMDSLIGALSVAFVPDTKQCLFAFLVDRSRLEVGFAISRRNFRYQQAKLSLSDSEIEDRDQDLLAGGKS